MLRYFARLSSLACLPGLLGCSLSMFIAEFGVIMPELDAIL